MRVFALPLALLALLPIPAAGQAVGERVAAIVNDDPISTFDVRQRMRLLIATQGIQVPEEAMAQFQQQALRDLIEERLKLQEAARYELTISDEEVTDEIMNIAASNGATMEQFENQLLSQGIDISTLREKIRADQAWEQLVRGRYGSRVNVTEREVDNAIADLRETVQQESYLVSEICLPLEQGTEERMAQIAMQMIGQMQQGVPFRAVAQQFSACPSAARGGDLGWLRPSDMDPDLADVVTQLGEGNISRPVPIDDMVKLIAVRQSRSPNERGEPAYEVAYAGAPVEAGEEVAERLRRLAEANPCNGQALSRDLGADIGVSVLPMLPQRMFDTAMHDVLSELEPGDVSDVIENEGAYHVFQLCEKDEGLGLPRRGAVMSNLESQELDLLSRRYLRDVERDTAVEILLSSEG